MSESQVAGLARSGAELVVHLRLVRPMTIDTVRASAVLWAERMPWLGEQDPHAEPGRRSFSCDLELHAGGSGPTLFRKAAVVTFGAPAESDAGWLVPVEWRAATLSPLFPVFVGELLVKPDGLTLDGHYAPPGGRLGYLLDVSLLNMAARQTGEWFLRKVAMALA